MFIGMGMPIPDIANIPGPSRPGYPVDSSYSFKMQVTGAVTIKANADNTAAGKSFTVTWPNGTEQSLSGNNASVAAPDATAGVISINKEDDTTFCDEVGIVAGQTNVSKIISWGANSWTAMANAFNGCTSLSDISTTKFTAKAGANIVKMFNGCTSLLEVDCKKWDLSAGVSWYGGSPFGGLVNLEKLDMTGMNIKLTQRSDNAFSSIGSATTNGCEFLMSNINWSTSTSTYTVYWFTSTKFKDGSNLSGWTFPSAGWAGTGMFNSASVIGNNAVLDLSGWTTYSGTLFPSFSSFNNALGNTGAKINMTNMGLSNVVSMSNSFYFTDISEIIGLNTWGATAGNVDMFRTFWGSDYLNFSDTNNFSNTFIASLTPTNFNQTFMQVGGSAPNGKAPNITNIDLSGTTSLSQTFSSAKFTNVPDLASATFSSSPTSFNQTFTSFRASDADSHLDFSNTTFKPSTFSSAFSGAYIDNITFGSNVDFSSLTNVTNMFYYMNNSQAVDVKFPTNANFSSLTTTGNWFAGLVGPTTGPLTTCQIDNLIRRFRATAYNSGLNVNFYNGKVTGAPSVVQAQEAELVANGWTITSNSTDTTLPFAYPSYSFNSDSVQSTTPSTLPPVADRNFTSSNGSVTVNQTTGVVSWSSGFSGDTNIRCTYADGCYNEVSMSIRPLIVPTTNNFSMAFDGTSYFNAGNPTALQFTGDFSISGWFKSSSATNQRIVSKDDGTNRSYLVQLQSNGVVRGTIFQGNSGKNTDSASGKNDGNWHHFVFTYEHNVGTKLYVDNGTPTVNSSAIAVDNDPSIVTIGARGDGANDFIGNIDEVAFFNRVLNATEVSRIYTASTTGQTADFSTMQTGVPVAWYRMGD